MIHSRIFCLTHVDPLLNSHQSNIPPTTRTHTQSQVYHRHNRTHVLIRHRYDSLRCHVQIGTKFRIPILSQLSKQTVTAGVKRSVKADVGSTITYSHTYVFSEGAHIYLYIYLPNLYKWICELLVAHNVHFATKFCGGTSIISRRWLCTDETDLKNQESHYLFPSIALLSEMHISHISTSGWKCAFVRQEYRVDTAIFRVTIR